MGKIQQGHFSHEPIAFKLEPIMRNDILDWRIAETNWVDLVIGGAPSINGADIVKQGTGCINRYIHTGERAFK